MVDSVEEGRLPEEPSPVAAGKAVTRRKKQDPVVTALILTILVIVVLTLVTVVYGMMSGIMGSGAPRTMAERRIMAGEAKIEAGSKDPLDWLAYIIALIDDGQFRKAQEVINTGKKKLPDQDISADMLYMQADLYLAQGDDEKALKTADQALKTIKDRYESGKANAIKTKKPDKASAWGLHANYWELMLLKAEVYEGRGDWANALKAYDEYLGEEKTAATIFAKRGAVKEKLGDKAGAEKDFRQCLSFIADDKDALAGLKRIGVKR